MPIVIAARIVFAISRPLTVREEIAGRTSGCSNESCNRSTSFGLAGPKGVEQRRGSGGLLSGGVRPTGEGCRNDCGRGRDRRRGQISRSLTRRSACWRSDDVAKSSSRPQPVTVSRAHPGFTQEGARGSKRHSGSGWTSPAATRRTGSKLVFKRDRGDASPGVAPTEMAERRRRHTQLLRRTSARRGRAASRLVRKGPDEAGALVGVAPGDAQRAAGESILGRRAQLGIVNGGEGREPLLVAARGIVVEVLLD